jgi:hypothetical protein
MASNKPAPRKLAELIEVAVHEAAHSVIAKKLGLRIGSASIRPTTLPDIPGMAGKVVLGVTYTACDGGIKSILVNLAGEAAEQEVLGQFASMGCAADAARVDRLLAANCFTDHALARTALMDDALRLVARHARDIERVAFHLLMKQTLTADEIIALMR